jgi:hypothetical protein
LTCVLECLHVLYTCSLAVRPWLPHFCLQRCSNLPLKPVTPTPVVHFCERVRWTVAMVSAVLSSPLPVVCTRGARAAQTCPVIAGSGSRFTDVEKLVQRTAAISVHM